MNKTDVQNPNLADFAAQLNTDVTNSVNKNTSDPKFASALDADIASRIGLPKEASQYKWNDFAVSPKSERVSTMPPVEVEPGTKVTFNGAVEAGSALPHVSVEEARAAVEATTPLPSADIHQAIGDGRLQGSPNHPSLNQQPQSHSADTLDAVGM